MVSVGDRAFVNSKGVRRRRTVDTLLYLLIVLSLDIVFIRSSRLAFLVEGMVVEWLDVAVLGVAEGGRVAIAASTVLR